MLVSVSGWCFHVYILKPDDSCSQEPKVQESLPCCHNVSLPVSAAAPGCYHMTVEATMQTHRHNPYSILRLCVFFFLSYSTGNIAVILL